MNPTPIARIAALALAAGACAPGADDRERLLLVTTTTVEGSGLLEALASAYNASQDRYRLATTAVGSGAALEIGRRGDADILLTHDPAGEARFMAEGHGEKQGRVMLNEYVVAGPPDDPAGVAGMTDLAMALDRIDRAGAPFVSRGDDSGAHRRELELRERAAAGASGGNPAAAEPATRGPGYIEAGSGMAEALRLAYQRGAYILTDSGTLRHLSAALGLEPLARGEPPEPNPYQYTLPARAGNSEGARDFVRWLLGPGQNVIADHGVARFGEPLFQPTAMAGSE